MMKATVVSGFSPRMLGMAPSETATVRFKTLTLADLRALLDSGQLVIDSGLRHAKTARALSAAFRQYLPVQRTDVRLEYPVIAALYQVPKDEIPVGSLLSPDEFMFYWCERL